MAGADGPEIRIGHAERDRAVEVLRDAAGEGRLTLAELDERIEMALQAKTRRDLREVLIDLVPAGPLDEMLDPDRASELVKASLERMPGHRWDDPLVLQATWEDVNKRGQWEVPPFLETHTVAGSIRLDFTAARMLARVTDIVHMGGAGDLILIVPTTFAVNTDRVVSGLGSVKNHAHGTARDGQPLVSVRGSLGMGTLKVRQPNWWDRKMQERALRPRG